MQHTVDEEQSALLLQCKSAFPCPHAPASPSHVYVGPPGSTQHDCADVHVALPHFKLAVPPSPCVASLGASLPPESFPPVSFPPVSLPPESFVVLSIPFDESLPPSV